MNEDEMYDAYMEQEMEEADAGSGRLMFLNADHEQNFAAIIEQYKFDIATDSDLIVAYITAVPDVYEKVSGALSAYEQMLDGPYWVVVALGAANIYTNGMFNTLKRMEVL